MELSRSASLPHGCRPGILREKLIRSPSCASAVADSAGKSLNQHSNTITSRPRSFTNIVRNMTTFLSRSRSKSTPPSTLALKVFNPAIISSPDPQPCRFIGPRTIQEMVDERFEEMMKGLKGFIADDNDYGIVDDHLQELLAMLREYYHEQLRVPNQTLESHGLFVEL